MKIAPLALSIALTGLAGCASQNAVDVQGIQLKTIEERMTALESRVQRVERTRMDSKANDATRYCFNNGQAFSEGSIYAGRICQRQTGMMVFENGKPVTQPLVWNVWQYR